MYFGLSAHARSAGLVALAILAVGSAGAQEAFPPEVFAPGTAPEAAPADRPTDAADASGVSIGAPTANQQRLTATDGRSSDYFGYAVDIQGTRAVVGAIYDDDRGTNSGSVYVFEASGGMWTQVAKLQANDGTSSDYFGRSVSLDGDRILIGASGDDDRGSSSGSAYIFERIGGAWTQVAKLAASDGTSSDLFGYAVSLDGSRALVGAYGDDDRGSSSGAAYVFDLSGGAWAQTAKLAAADGATSDYFGASVSLEGTRALVGSYGDNSNTGSAYVFNLDGGAWGQTAKLSAADGRSADYFGESLDLSGSRVIIGAAGDDSGGTNKGSAYIFSAQNGAWVQTAKLVASDGSSFDFFGSSVALDGSRAVIGARDDSDLGYRGGASYSFQLSAGAWVQASKLRGSVYSNYAYRGSAVALDSGRAFVGAYGESNTGAAYVYDIAAPLAAVNDDVTTAEDTTLVIPVLDNDTGDALIITSASGASNGTLEVITSASAPDSVRYVPNADFNGEDQFTYVVASGSEQASAVVTVTVTAVNDAPIAAPDEATTNEDVTVSIDVLANDTDPDGDDLTVVGIPEQPRNGVAGIQNGRLVYTPNANFLGPDLVLYTVSDGTVNTFGRVMITVTGLNDAPVAVDDVTATDEDEAVTITVLANDSDPDDGTALSIVSVSSPSNGTATLNDNGTITYTPEADFNGTDSFDYTIDDGDGPVGAPQGFAARARAIATVTVTVRPVNDAPLAVADDARTDEDEAVEIAVLANDTDVDGDALTVVALGTPVSGTVATDGSVVTYTPEADFNGQDTFAYTIADASGVQAESTVTVTVRAVNDAPVFTSQPVTVVREGNLYTYTARATDGDGDALTFQAPMLPDWLALTDNADGSATLRGTPADADVGSYSITIFAEDGSDSARQEFSLVVTDEANPPVAVADAASTAEDTPVVIDVLANDTDADGDDLNVVGIPEQPRSGVAAVQNGEVVYSPGPDFVGTDSFFYTVSDGALTAFGEVTVTVGGRNDAPVAVDDAATLDEDGSVVVSVLANDRDPDNGTSLSVTAVSDPSNGTATIGDDGAITYTPEADFFGEDTFTYTIDDGDGPVGSPSGFAFQATSTATVTVTVRPVNDAPLATDDAASTGRDNTVVVAVLDNDTDADGDALEVSAAGGASFGTVMITGGTSVTYTPNAGFTGQDSFLYTAVDGNGGASQAQVTVTVASQAPVATNDTATTDEDTAVSIDVLGNDTSQVGGTLAVTSASGAANGVTTVNSDGTVLYTPALNFAGQDSFTYTLSDDGGQANATVTVTVRAINDAPSAVVVTTPSPGSVLTLSGDQSVPVFVEWTAATDPEGDAITYRWELAATSAFSSVLLSVESSVTNAETSYGALADALAQIGVASGDIVGVFHRVVTSDGSAETPGAASPLTIERGIMTAGEGEAPLAFGVTSAAPNPTRGSLTLALNLPRASDVYLEVFDILGRRVHSVEKEMAAGRGLALDADLNGLPPGLYAFRVTADLGGGTEVHAGTITVAR